jgi:hypothetical protein
MRESFAHQRRGVSAVPSRALPDNSRPEMTGRMILISHVCVVTCVVTLPSLSVSRAVGHSRSGTSNGSEHALDPHEHCPIAITHVLFVSLGYSRR